MTVIIDGSAGVAVTGTTGFTSQTNGLGTGLVPAQQFYALQTALAGANATGAQNILGVGVTLVGSTVYQFEAVYALSRSAGTTSHTVGYGFGGTATINNIAYTRSWQYATANFASPASATGSYTVNSLIQTTTSTSLPNENSSVASAYWVVFIKGTVSVNAGGTFIPQYSLSAAPGGAYTTAIGSYFKISPLAASGSNVNIGTWA